MIIDRLENYAHYFSMSDARIAFERLLSLSKNIDDGIYPIQGEDIYLRVMSYKTRTIEEGKVEAHRKYIDIQTVLTGAEGIDYFPLDGLNIRVPYNDAKDVELFERPVQCLCRVNVAPGTFALFHPRDAHMPQLIVGEDAMLIKKAVVKIKVELLFPDFKIQ
jgi:biofilm protein TabA